MPQMKEEILVTVGIDGKTEISVNGAKGKRCKDITKDIEKELGQVTDTKNTSEYYQPEIDATLIQAKRA